MHFNVSVKTLEYNFVLKLFIDEGKRAKHESSRRLSESKRRGVEACKDANGDIKPCDIGAKSKYDITITFISTN